MVEPLPHDRAALTRGSNFVVIAIGKLHALVPGDSHRYFARSTSRRAVPPELHFFSIASRQDVVVVLVQRSAQSARRDGFLGPSGVGTRAVVSIVDGIGTSVRMCRIARIHLTVGAYSDRSRLI